MIALISDIHANLEALQAVLDYLGRLPVRQVVCLGDVVGYGASPVECIALVRERCSHWIRGNHEQGLLYYPQDFNPKARAALEWTKEQINQLPRAQKREIWIALDATPAEATLGEDVLLVHGSPSDPIREYVLPRAAADAPRLAEWFRAMGAHRLCFIGHSHVPSAITPAGGVFLPGEQGMTVETAQMRYIVNVGSVGQPRDGDPRACFATLEEGGTVAFHRVPYDVRGAMARIRAVPELPDTLAERLEQGR